MLRTSNCSEMEASQVSLKILSLCCLSMTVGILLNKQYYLTTFDNILQSPSVIFYGGLIAIGLGIYLVDSFANKANWSNLMITLGYLSLGKGFVLIVFPKFIKRFKIIFSYSINSIYFLTFFLLILGLFFGYFAFL